jgi:hypothetical protein
LYAENVPGIEMIRFNAMSADENAENIKIIWEKTKKVFTLSEIFSKIR